MSGPLIIGHRGASRFAPENTMAAFELAIEAGADGIEFDVRLARDGVPVVIHDADLRRTGSLDGKVGDLTSAELGRVDVGSAFDPKFAGQYVPRLEDVLARFAGFEGLFYIELKCGKRDGEALASAVCDQIRRLQVQSRVIVMSFDLRAIASVKNHLPNVQTAFLLGLEVRRYFRYRRHMIDLALKHGSDQIAVHRSLVTKGLLKEAISNSLPVAVWTVNDPRWVSRGRSLGITSLITDDPARMKRAVLRIGDP